MAVFERARAGFIGLDDPYNVARVDTDIADVLCGPDPRASLVAAGRSLAVYRDFGAVLQEGKALTYMAIAQGLLGNPDEEIELLDAAEECLTVAGYRSGLDRLRIARASRALRSGNLILAGEFARATVESVEGRKSHVYLSIVARVLLRHVGDHADTDQSEFEAIVKGVSWLEGVEFGSAGVPIAYLTPLGLPQ